MRPSLIDRLFSKINFDGPIPPLHPDMSACWLWTGWKRPTRNRRNGTVRKVYGGIDAKIDGVPKKLYPHRVMFEHANGRKLGEWELVNHKCHVQLCVNPMHLEATDISGNALDTAARAAAALGVG